MVDIGLKTSRNITDYKLSRYACYLITQNGDARKKAIKEAKKLNITSCLITADVENIASNKTILSQGGVLENTVMWKNNPLNRYWIKL